MKVGGVIFEFENKMVLLFRDFYEKHYMVPCCSCVAFIWCIFFAFVIVVPWIAAWSAGGELVNYHTLRQHLKFLTVNFRFSDRVLDQGAHLL